MIFFHDLYLPVLTPDIDTLAVTINTNASGNLYLPVLTPDIDTWPDGTEVYVCDPVQQTCRYGWINKRVLHLAADPSWVYIEVKYVPGTELSHIVGAEQKKVFRFTRPDNPS